MSFQLTAEQADCVEKFLTRKNLTINAYAGTGKTSTVIALAKAAPRKGTFLAFNKAIAEDAQKRLPGNVNASTTHSLAFRAMRSKLGIEKMTGSLSGGYVAREMALKPAMAVGDVAIKGRALGYIIAQTVGRFCRSDSDVIEAWHVPLEGKLERLDDRVIAPFQAFVVGKAMQLWEMMKDPKSSIPCGHDGYLRMFVDTKPEVPGDVVFLDEAQDTNGIVLRLVRAQEKQIVAVGDRWQNLYSWRGSRNAMTELEAVHMARLTTSFRFGTAIANNATRMLRLLGETAPLRGFDGRTSAIGPVDTPDAILFRTNAALLDELVARIDAGERPYVAGGVAEIMSFVEGAERLMAGQPVDRPVEFFGFTSWGDVQEAAEGEGGEELRRWVKVIDDYGCDKLRTVLSGLPTSAARASITLSSGHRSKGLEWRRVRLHDGFLRGVRTAEEDRNKTAIEGGAAKMTEADHEAELMLAYVAMTRAMETLEIPDRLAEKVATLEAKPSRKAA